MMAAMSVLVAIRREQASRYHKNLSERKNFRLNYDCVEVFVLPVPTIRRL